MAIGVLAYYVFEERPTLILVAEAVLLGSAYVALRIYRSIIAPVRLLSQGAAALEDEDFSVKLMPTGSREMDGVVHVYNNMIDQLRAEKVSGRQREEFLDRLLQSARLGIAVLDFDGRLASANEWLAAKRRSAAFEASVLQPALHPRQRPGEMTGSGHQRVLHGPGGRRYHVERSSFIDRGFERGFVVIQDVTAELLTAEKEAYGKVIRMMAHEVNNTNAAIVSILKTLLEAATEADPQLPGLATEYLPAAIGRADTMTAFIRNFAEVVRLPEPHLKPVQLADLLRRTSSVMATTLAERRISLKVDLEENCPPVRLDATQIEQVIINALTNAGQSIGSGGAIVLSTTCHPTGFTVADDGPGIKAEHADQLFTPFFSTKPNGQGVGLTLTREILENHRATYQLETEPDGWTRLRVQFPSVIGGPNKDKNYGV